MEGPSYLLDAPLLTFDLFRSTYYVVDAKRTRRLAADGLPRIWFDVLVRLGRAGRDGMRMAELADQVSLSASGLTRAVDRIEGVGLVARSLCPSDRRGALVQLTSAGREQLTAVMPRHVELLEELFNGVLSPDELVAFRAALWRIRSAADGSSPV